MLYTLEQVFTNRPPLLTVRHDAPMLDAFRLIIERRLGQLPWWMQRAGCSESSRSKPSWASIT
ncbi:MAG: hypothetical protein HZY76_23335 [Anaerolineae bacterium]|nr:MAG: hypothetical protein HZY76_23335 [Anaerolineae bacterium]